MAREARRVEESKPKKAWDGAGVCEEVAVAFRFCNSDNAQGVAKVGGQNSKAEIFYRLSPPHCPYQLPLEFYFA